MKADGIQLHIDGTAQPRAVEKAGGGSEAERETSTHGQQVTN